MARAAVVEKKKKGKKGYPRKDERPREQAVEHRLSGVNSGRGTCGAVTFERGIHGSFIS